LSTVSIAQTVSPVITNADDSDVSRPDGLGIATWLMASIFGLFLSVSVCGLLIKACGGQRKPGQSDNNTSVVNRILAGGGQDKTTTEIKVIDITKECLYSRFSDYSSEAQTFTVDLGGVDAAAINKPAPTTVRVSQIRLPLAPRPRSVSGILRPLSLLPSPSSIMCKTRQHLRTYSAPERKQRRAVFSFGHVKAAKSVTLESGVGDEKVVLEDGV
jgi:hypothetical protein